jgi:serine/threonine protein kinase
MKFDERADFYQISRRVHRGQGETYRGWSPYGLEVALKVGFRNQIHREAEILDWLERNGVQFIPMLIEVGDDYLVTEWEQGIPLDEIKPLITDDISSFREAYNLFITAMANVTEQVLALHGFGVASCDLNETNILVQDTGSTTILDFGEASLFSRDGENDFIQCVRADEFGIITLIDIILGRASFNFNHWVRRSLPAQERAVVERLNLSLDILGSIVDDRHTISLLEIERRLRLKEAVI